MFEFSESYVLGESSIKKSNKKGAGVQRKPAIIQQDCKPSISRKGKERVLPRVISRSLVRNYYYYYIAIVKFTFIK